MNDLYLFKNSEGKQRYYRIYDETLKNWPVPFKEHYVDTSFGDTYVIECGKKDGEPAVFMHGLMDSSASWIENVKEIGSKYRLILIDSIIDTGKSRPEKLPSGIKELTRWFKKVIDRLYLRNIHLIGHSYGGFISFKVACALPERIGKLVLLAPAGVFGNFSIKYLLKSGLSNFLFPGESSIDKIIELSVAPSNRCLVSHPVMRQSKAAAVNSRWYLPVLPVFTGAGKLKKYRKPVLLLAGEFDWLFNIRNIVRNAEKYMPGIRIFIIKDAGHMLHLEKSGEVNDNILKFLESGPATSDC